MMIHFVPGVLYERTHAVRLLSDSFCIDTVYPAHIVRLHSDKHIYLMPIRLTAEFRTGTPSRVVPTAQEKVQAWVQPLDIDDSEASSLPSCFRSDPRSWPPPKASSAPRNLQEGARDYRDSNISRLPTSLHLCPAPEAPAKSPAPQLS